MKHLKKYNEAVNYNKLLVDLDYLHDCFIDFIDEGNYKIVRPEDNNDRNNMAATKQWAIYLTDCYNSEQIYTTNVNILKNYYKRMCDIYLEIENCIDKVKLKYPDIEYSIYESDEIPGERSDAIRIMFKVK